MYVNNGCTSDMTQSITSQLQQDTAISSTHELEDSDGHLNDRSDMNSVILVIGIFLLMGASWDARSSLIVSCIIKNNALRLRMVSRIRFIGLLVIQNQSTYGFNLETN